MKQFILLSLALSYLAHASEQHQKAIVITPVANCIGFELESESVIGDYHGMPASWGPNKQDKIACPRLHQLLFNETVTILETKNEQALIKVHNTHWHTKQTDQHASTCWTLRKYLLPLCQCPAQKVSTQFFPKPFGSTDTDEQYLTITLMLPYYDEATNQTYSAGTRFKAMSSKYESHYVAWIYSPQKEMVIKTTIPVHLCAPLEYISRDEQISEFVFLLERWVDWAEGKIPFVWGGCGLTLFYPRMQFALKPKLMDSGEQRFVWQVKNQRLPIAGFDSSGYILRAAQICSLPYFFKNTQAALQGMKKIKRIEALSEGDLIWIPGALLVISRINEGRVIGMLGYQYGYGSLFATTLSHLFTGIKTFDDLLAAIKEKRAFSLKKPDGSIAREVTECALLSLKSIWKKHPTASLIKKATKNMLKEIYYVSGNAGKQQEVRDFFAQHLPDIELKMCEIDLVEIQSLDQQEIALDKARQAWQLLKQPLLLDDAGFYFKRYDRFPGTLCKFVYESIGFTGLARLYAEDDPASFDLTLVFMHGPDSFESFQYSSKGTLVAPIDMQRSNLPYLKIFKPEGCTRTLFELKQDGLDQPYNSRIRALEKFKEWYENSEQFLPSNHSAKKDHNLLK